MEKTLLSKTLNKQQQKKKLNGKMELSIPSHAQNPSREFLLISSDHTLVRQFIDIEIRYLRVNKTEGSEPLACKLKQLNSQLILSCESSLQSKSNQKESNVILGLQITLFVAILILFFGTLIFVIVLIWKKKKARSQVEYHQLNEVK